MLAYKGQGRLAERCKARDSKADKCWGDQPDIGREEGSGEGDLGHMNG